MDSSVLGKLNAIFTYLAWMFLAGMAICFLLGYFGIKFSMPVYYLIFGGFFAFAALHFVAAFWVHCPSCGKCLTIQGFRGVHPGSINKSWSSVEFHWFSGSLGCIQCVRVVSTNDL
ncbi:MAG: hypothetical protein KUF77_05885 [Candidatus Thiodiazotropha sp. (ex Lucina aurantia)]|nr:hypothetical protein [Candidatus Thiodiazotropha taylori]MBV2100339.1 hypothetical protein [Candidatus Thiodiazotropha sp. (ex Codakia orbicularis)]MBV2102537.1 hypothetical protein [Candidatus Thiodiazotropha sp. (ex Lucina aurantia)]MBV2116685.1 hypothetical protein [Candidatus Thiodiazotropha sp. (ex Lucina aurantia)]